MRTYDEKGSVLFMILVAVILFAALSYTVAQMMRPGSAELIGEQQASTYADEILGYGRTMRQGVQTVRISNGCEDEDISFENSFVSGYTNGTNTDCQIFNAGGGGLNYVVPVDDWMDDVSRSSALYQEWYFTGGVYAQDIGTSAGDAGKDLVVFLPYIKRQICIEINKKLGVDNPGDAPAQENGNAWAVANTKFDGDYSTGGIQLERGGNIAGCFEGSVSNTPPEGTYHFFQVLQAR